MKNSVQLAENEVISIECDGYINYEIASELVSNVLELTQKLHTEKKQVHIIANLAGITGHQTSVRKIGFDASKTMDFDKAAIIGVSKVLSFLIILIIRTSGKQDKIRVLNTKEEAQEWFNNK